MLCSKKIDRNYPVHLGEADIRQLVDKVSSFAENCEVQFSCNDGATRVPQEIEDLFKYRNTANRKITSLMLLASAYDPRRSVDIRIHEHSGENIRIELLGPERETIELSDYVEDYLMGRKPWYHIVSRINFALTGTFLPIIIYACLLVVYFFAEGSDKNSEAASDAETKMAILFGLLLFIVPIGIGFILEKFKEVFFPKTVFLIGDGIQRNKNQETIRTVIIVAFLVSLASGILLLVVS